MIKEIQKELRVHAKEKTGNSLRKFVPGAMHVTGVSMPVINELVKKYKHGGFELVEALWKTKGYEERMMAAKMIRPIAKTDPQRAIALVERYSLEINNWAICDTLGMQSLKNINKKMQKEIFALAQKLSDSDIMWQRRLSLVLVEDFCKQPAIHLEIQMLVNKQEAWSKKLDKAEAYYIKKAIVWLRSAMEKKADR
ncbi:MAG: DNA alkylation repair protein [Chitinophagales bacterium]